MKKKKMIATKLIERHRRINVQAEEGEDRIHVRNWNLYRKLRKRRKPKVDKRKKTKTKYQIKKQCIFK